MRLARGGLSSSARWLGCLHSRPLRRGAHTAAIIGAGPGGFYTAHKLLQLDPDIKVHIYEKLPVPFGLARFGVAPDHQEVKNCNDTFTTVAGNDRCELFCNVNVGNDVSLAELRDAYSSVVLAYGTTSDRDFGLPGEDLDGVHSARTFVGWYNGSPEHVNLKPDLSSETAVIFGQGNVAVDIARMLLSPIEELAKTDITADALAALADSNVKQVHIVGRRGAGDVAFTIKEARELSRMTDCYAHIATEDVTFTEEEQAHLDSKRPRKRLTALLQKIATEEYNGQPRRWDLEFKQGPVEFLESTTESGKVGGVKLEINELVGEAGSYKAQGTGEYNQIDCGLVLKSIGYKGMQLSEDTPFNAGWGIVPNEYGRVEGSPGLYASGWIKTGPTGVIATTMNNGFETAGAIVADMTSGAISKNTKTNPASIVAALDERGVEVVSFEGWLKINAVEVAEGEAIGKPREKVTDIATMLSIAAQGSN